MTSNPFLLRLRQCASLSAADEHFLDRMTRNRASVPADRQLRSDGEQPTQIHVVIEGLACRYKILADGRRQILAFMVPGDACGLLTFLLDRMDHSLGTVTGCTIATISRHEIETAMAERPGVARAFWLSSMLDEAILREWLVNLGRRNAYERMAHLLCEMYLRHAVAGVAVDDRFSLPLSQADLADALGLSTVYVNKTITRLRAAGIIETDRRQIRILEPAELSSAAGFDAAYLHLGGFSHEAAQVSARRRIARL